MKKLAISAMAFAPVFASLADDATTPTMDTDAAETLLTAAQTGLTSLLDAATPVLTALVLAGLAIWGAMALVRIVKRAFRTGS